MSAEETIRRLERDMEQVKVMERVSYRGCDAVQTYLRNGNTEQMRAAMQWIDLKEYDAKNGSAA